MNKLTTRELILSAALAAISAATQLIHIGYQSPQWGMWVDIVAVSWIMAFFLFGVKSSLLVSFISALVITLFAPDTWLGASMKWTATVPLIITLYLWLRLNKKNPLYYSKWTNIIIPLIISLILRSAIIIPLNYYYAIPIWTGMSPSKAMSVIPWFIIAGFNSLQTIIDIALSWIIVFVFRINRFSSWSNNI